MPIDPWAATVAQEFTAQEPDTLRRLWGIIAAQKRAMFDIRASVLANVSDIVADLRAQVADIAAASAAAAAAAATATAASAAATAAVAAQAAQLVSINALIGQQTWPDAGNASSGNVNPLPTSAGSFATITFNVPAGYTLAVVVGNSSAAVTGPLGSAQMMTRIAGLDGPAMTVGMPSAGVGNGSSNFSRVFGVTPGGTFTVETRMFSPNGGAGLLTTAASVTFSR